MSSSGLWQDIRNNPLVLVFAVLLHIALIVMLSINLLSSEIPKSALPHNDTVKAVVVNSPKVDAEVEKLKHKAKLEQQEKLADDKEREQEAEKARRELELKQTQQAETEKKKQKLEQEQEQIAEQQRQATLKKKQAEEKKLVEDKQRQAAAEKQRKEAETKRQAELQRKAEAEKQKRLADEAEARRKQAEADLKHKIEEEEQREEAARQQAERARLLDSLRSQYVKLIEQKVERVWLRPANLAKGVSCEVVVTQTIMGDVTSVNLRGCSADSAFQQSIERAVWKASPLPPAPNPDVFDREINFTFRPK